MDHMNQTMQDPVDLKQHRREIVKQWFDCFARNYPEDTHKFLVSQKDPFANPVGRNTLNALSAVFDELIAPAPDPKKLAETIDPIIRVRAVQTLFTASQAVSFVFELKTVVRRLVKPPIDTEALYHFDCKVDQLALVAFETFTSCREKIYELKANTEKSRFYQAFARAGLIREIDDKDPQTTLNP